MPCVTNGALVQTCAERHPFGLPWPQSESDELREFEMQLVRLGHEPSQVGADVRAALAGCGPGEQQLGGVALLGLTLPGQRSAVDAVLLLPRGVVVVVGVDLPDPAIRVEAPLQATWRIDGWLLTRADGRVNPVPDALAVTAAVRRALPHGADAPQVGTVIALGPYVEHVVRPDGEADESMRVLHPRQHTLRDAILDLATAPRCHSVPEVKRFLESLGVNDAPVTDPALLTGEGFAAAPPSMEDADTGPLPLIDVATDGAPASFTGPPLPGPGARGRIRPMLPRRRLDELRQRVGALPWILAGVVAAVLLSLAVAALLPEAGPPGPASPATPSRPG